MEAGGISTQDPDTGKWWCVPYAVVTPIIIVASHIPPQTPWDPGLQSGPFAKPDGGGGGPTAPVLAPRAPSENNNACLLKASAAVWAVSEDVLALTGAGLAVKGLRGAQILAAGGTTLLLDQLGIEAAEIGSREMDKAIMRGTIRRAGSIAMASFVEAVANPGESDGWIGTVRSMVPIWNSLHAILSAVSTCRGGGSGE